MLSLLWKSTILTEAQPCLLTFNEQGFILKVESYSFTQPVNPDYAIINKALNKFYRQIFNHHSWLILLTCFMIIFIDSNND